MCELCSSDSRIIARSAGGSCSAEAAAATEAARADAAAGATLAAAREWTVTQSFEYSRISSSTTHVSAASATAVSPCAAATDCQPSIHVVHELADPLRSPGLCHHLGIGEPTGQRLTCVPGGTWRIACSRDFACAPRSTCSAGVGRPLFARTGKYSQPSSSFADDRFLHVCSKSHTYSCSRWTVTWQQHQQQANPHAA